MTHHAKCLALPNSIEDSVDNFRMGLHLPARLFGRARIGFLEFLDNLEDTIAANHGIINDKFESGRVLQDHGAADQALDALAMAGQEVQAALLLLCVAKNTDEDD